MPVVAMLPLLAALGLAAQDDASREEPADRLEFMKRSVSIYDVRAAGAEGEASAFELDPEPIFRLSNPVGDAVDGAIFFWVDDSGRPAAAVQAFQLTSGTWLHEFTSLSTEPLVAEASRGASWTPAVGGIEFRPIPGAPDPAGTAAGRLAQMRALAREFGARDHFLGREWYELRLLPRPLARHGGSGPEVLDGALFGFVMGTDPEAFLLIEARPDEAGEPRWQYAFAPMTAYGLEGLRDGSVVWSLPMRPEPRDPDLPFYTREYTPED